MILVPFMGKQIQPFADYTEIGEKVKIKILTFSDSQENPEFNYISLKLI